MTEPNYTIPHIMRCADGKWYIFFEYYHEGKMVPVKRSEQLNRIKNLTEKEAEFKALLKARTAWLEMGWNPITDPKFQNRSLPDANAIENLNKMSFEAALDFAFNKKEKRLE